MEVPWQMLSKEALRGVVEEYITREGTDYGAEYTLDQKVEHVMKQLKRGEAVLVYDDETETCNLIPAAQRPREDD
jgi:uncharacterized protein YheU (UPF0270 family)